MTAPTVHCRTEGPVLHVTIDRPDRLNALDPATNARMAEVFDRFAADDGLWLAVVRGTGDRAFSVGADVLAMNEAAGGGAAYGVPRSGFGGLTSRFDLDKPVIAAVNGLALGGGFEIALAADLVIAADHARFGLPEPRLGIVPYGGGMQRLSRRLGHARAMELLLGCDPIDAATALSWGLVNEVVPAADLDSAVARWVERLLKAAPLALQAVKHCVRIGLEGDLESAIRAQETAPAPPLERTRRSADLREGLSAFAQKRPPVWSGR